MNAVNELIPTRESLLSRLKDWGDQEGWRVFFETYWKLIYNSAIKAGLTDAEAQDVVQETVISLMKSMPRFEYNPERGSFKSWLLQLASWRARDQFRKRQRGIEYVENTDESQMESRKVMADPLTEAAISELESEWEKEWENNLWEAAIERVKKKADHKQYQAFDLYMLRKWPVLKVAGTLKMNVGSVYLAKHRIGNLIKAEIHDLRAKPI
jgi:RNA polymerase sigma-70 factor (ECF subfamily)